MGQEDSHNCYLFSVYSCTYPVYILVNIYSGHIYKLYASFKHTVTVSCRETEDSVQTLNCTGLPTDGRLTSYLYQMPLLRESATQKWKHLDKIEIEKSQLITITINATEQHKKWLGSTRTQY